MKKSIITLVKDLVIAAILAGLTYVLFSIGDAFSSGALAFFCLSVAGIPFGWRWASKIITAASLKGVGIKLLIAVFLGWFAIFVVLGGDLIRCIWAIIKEKKTAASNQAVAEEEN